MERRTDWEQQPAKLAQKDVDARWTKKNDESFYGYKSHVGVDKAHKLIRTPHSELFACLYRKLDLQ